jgi:hypothetical protein
MKKFTLILTVALLVSMGFATEGKALGQQFRPDRLPAPAPELFKDDGDDQRLPAYASPTRLGPVKIEKYIGGGYHNWMQMLYLEGSALVDRHQNETPVPVNRKVRGDVIISR